MQVNAKCNSSEGSSALNPQSRDTQTSPISLYCIRRYQVSQTQLAGGQTPNGNGPRLIWPMMRQLQLPQVHWQLRKVPFCIEWQLHIYMMTFFVEKSFDEFIHHLSTWKTNKMKMKIFSPVCLAKHHINNPQRLIQSSDKNPKQTSL